MLLDALLKLQIRKKEINRMKKQIAIRLEEKDIMKLKIYAIQHQTTVQAIAENYLTGLIKEENKMQELWLKDYRGGYTLIYSIASDRSMSVDNILQFLGTETLDQMAEALEYDIREVYENLTTERPDYIKVIIRATDLITLESGDKINTGNWNGETWNDKGRQYAPVYEWMGIERNSTYLIGVVEV